MKDNREAINSEELNHVNGGGAIKLNTIGPLASLMPSLTNSAETEGSSGSGAAGTVEKRGIPGDAVSVYPSPQ